jgi:AcrR family transcriptional regulator
MDAALRVFAGRGYHAASLDEVARAAGVTKGTIYHYYTNKEDLLLKLVAHHDHAVFREMADALRAIKGPASSRVRFVMRRGFAAPESDVMQMRLLIFGELYATAPALFARVIRRALVDGWRLIARLIEDGKATGEFRRDADAEVAVRIFTSGLMQQLLWRATMGLNRLDPFDRDRLVDSSIELLLHSLRPIVVAPARSRKRKPT